MEADSEPRGEHAVASSLGFDHRGHRIGGEIDLEHRKIHPVSQTTPQDWAEFERQLRGQENQ